MMTMTMMMMLICLHPEHKLYRQCSCYVLCLSRSKNKTDKVPEIIKWANQAQFFLHFYLNKKKKNDKNEKDTAEKKIFFHSIFLVDCKLQGEKKSWRKSGKRLIKCKKKCKESKKRR